MQTETRDSYGLVRAFPAVLWQLLVRLPADARELSNCTTGTAKTALLHRKFSAYRKWLIEEGWPHGDAEAVAVSWKRALYEVMK